MILMTLNVLFLIVLAWIITIPAAAISAIAYLAAGRLFASHP
jgi:phosphate/sulfate permease